MTHPHGFQRAISTCTIWLSILTLSVAIGLAQAGGTPSSSTTGSPTPQPLENRMTKMEEQLTSIDKKLQKPPKDNWDKLSTLSGFISGLLVAAIGALVTVMYQRRETAMRRMQSEREEEDRKAKLKLEELENTRAETQLEIERTNKEREITISQAQTVRELLPSLQSNDPKSKQAALTLIAFLGNAELAAQLSGLYQTDFAPMLQDIVSMPGAKSDARFKAAVALVRLVSREDAVQAFVKLSQDEKIATAERLLIAEELEKLNAPEKAAEVQLKLAIDPKIGTEAQDRAVANIKRLNFTYKAREALSQIGRDEQAEITQRIRAIDTLSKLDDAQGKLGEWNSILSDLTRVAKTSPELRDISKIFNQFGQSEKGAEEFWKIASDPNIEIATRYFAADQLATFGIEEYAQKAQEEKAKALRQIAGDSQAAPWLRIVALNQGLGPESNEEKAIILREIIESPEANAVINLWALNLLKKLGYTEEAQKKREELASKSWLNKFIFSLTKGPKKESAVEPEQKT